VDEAGDGGVVVLAERVRVLADAADELTADGDVGLAQRLVGIGRRKQGEIIGGDRDGQIAGPLLDTEPFVGSEADDFFEHIEAADAVAHLPLPVVPIVDRDARIVLAQKLARAVADDGAVDRLYFAEQRAGALTTTRGRERRR